MISHESVLDPEVVPERELVAHRRDELESLLKHYRRVRTNGTQSYLQGPQGTGKTPLARLSLQILRDERGARIAYVNCGGHRTRADVLFKPADEVLTTTSHRRSTPVNAISQQLDDEPDEQRWIRCRNSSNRLFHPPAFGTVGQAPAR
jgi:Cdc6-like AAA superfamily ATPase